MRIRQNNNETENLENPEISSGEKIKIKYQPKKEENLDISEYESL